MSSPQPNEFTYETKKLLWKNMSFTMRNQLRSNSLNCIIDNTMPYKFDNVRIASKKAAAVRYEHWGPSFAPYFVWISRSNKYVSEDNEYVGYNGDDHHLWEFFKNRVVLKSEEMFLTPSTDPQKVYHVPGSPRELMSQFLAFVFSRPGTEIKDMELHGLSDFDIADTFTVESLTVTFPKQDDCNLPLLNKLQKPPAHLSIENERDVTNLAKYDLIRTVKEVQVCYDVTDYRKVLLIESPAISFSTLTIGHFEPITLQSEIFEFINEYARQDRPIGHFFKKEMELKQAEFIFDSLVNHHKGIGWKSKCIGKRLCATILRNNLEVTAFYETTNLEFGGVWFFVKFMELGTAKNREELGEAVHFSCKELGTIAKYMDFHQKLRICKENENLREVLRYTSSFINELRVHCKTPRLPSFYVDGIAVSKNKVHTIFGYRSTVRHLHIKGVWLPDFRSTSSVTALNITLETTKVYPAGFYNYLTAPAHTVGTLKVKNRKVLKHANEIINSYNLTVENEKSTS